MPIWRIDLDTPKKKHCLLILPLACWLINISAPIVLNATHFHFFINGIFLRPFVNRAIRDLIMVGVLLLAIVSTIIGFFMLKRQVKNPNGHAQSTMFNWNTFMDCVHQGAHFTWNCTYWNSTTSHDTKSAIGSSSISMIKVLAKPPLEDQHKNHYTDRK